MKEQQGLTCLSVSPGVSEILKLRFLSACDVISGRGLRSCQVSLEVEAFYSQSTTKHSNTSHSASVNSSWISLLTPDQNKQTPDHISIHYINDEASGLEILTLWNSTTSTWNCTVLFECCYFNKIDFILILSSLFVCLSSVICLYF